MAVVQGNLWMLPVLAGIIVGLLCAAMKILWSKVEFTLDKVYANSTELAVLREKIKILENRAPVP